jgi:tetratricopeptide (TPR) repeat protein
MSENLEQTQSSQPLKEDDTQPIKPIRKPARWRSILIGILGFLLLLGLGGFGGYSAGIGDRVSAQEGILTAQLAQQYQFALVDIQFGRFEAARQRLEYIIANDPSYPGATDLLTQTLVMSTIPTATPTVTLTPTPDFSGAESAYQRAQQLIAAQDWANALAALDTIRKLDPGYKTAQVDGMYYFALRNQGVNLITNQGNLEGGIYYLTLAERFGPLDNTANQLREGARLYITGASFWELDWMQAVTYFTEVGNGWPSMHDGTMNASQRLFIASMRYGDQLFENQQYCEAYEQYQVAVGIGQLQQPSTGNYNQAFIQCYPPTSTAEPTATAPPETPTETPTP